MIASIIIPLYNQQEFVEKAIESALNQTFKDAEVIVVNDGSTDSSLSIAKRYPVVIVDQMNKGLAGARNAGVLNSTGNFLLPLDADDWIEATYLEKTLPLMYDDTVGLVSTDMHFFGTQNTIIRIKPTTLSQEMLANRLLVCSLIRREAFLQTGGYNPRLAKGYEDWSLWIDILKRGWQHKVVSEALFHYRTKPQSMITEAGKFHEQLFGDIKKVFSTLY
jgi:glycosyltransferase involved in cell wall biosynthesis